MAYSKNYVAIAVIIYIIMIIFVVISKPDFIYDNKKMKFREFGKDKDKTLFSIGFVTIALALIIAVLFSFVGTTEEIKEKINYQYIPVPVQFMPNMQPMTHMQPVVQSHI